MSDERFISATKLDADKPPMDLLPWDAVEGVARVLDFGRVKYAPWNWRKGFEWSRLAAAALRHIFKHLGGEDTDPESGLSHIDHAICCLMFLSSHVKGGLGKDDRAHTLLDQATTQAGGDPRALQSKAAEPLKAKKWRVVRDYGAGPEETGALSYERYDTLEAAQRDCTRAFGDDKRYSVVLE